ncbi:AbrB/MazE/SpoVT family DNA-binding domain-containing protein [Accumulibacter sp.]|uniref:AbrB/MazE/SpoVT family DNA-binding domain-containing protein n=1 Tax=Accumulibacter sp. TaxID=2053492 RepID=UPI00258EE54F|nr:AbrB/MazE/SpoVT family DNA-binding domain-containing protein [Accumulibacter sp.]
MEQNRASHVLHITANWRGRPLVSRQGGEPDRQHDHETGLRIQAAIDENAYTSGIKVSDEELASLAIEPRRVSWRMELPADTLGTMTNNSYCSSYYCLRPYYCLTSRRFGMAIATITLSSKGQVVIPKEIREALHWDAGTELTLVSSAHGVTLKAMPKKVVANWPI